MHVKERLKALRAAVDVLTMTATPIPRTLHLSLLGVRNISTNVTQSVVPGYSVYAAAKAGLDTLTRYLALELAPKRIRVNAILPGVVETPIFETLMPEEAVGGFLSGFGPQVPLGRVGQPADIARIAVALCSADNNWVTGALVPVDGGSALGTVDDAG